MRTEAQYQFTLPVAVSKHSKRQSYVFDLIFKEILGINYQFISANDSGKYLSYGSQPSEFFIQAHELMHQNSIEKQQLSFVSFENKSYPFKINGDKSLYPFDLFAVCFYTVTRYEEYFPTQLDEHGRYRAEESWLVSQGLLTQPIVHVLAENLKQKIETYFGVKLNYKNQCYIEPTIDIDNAYAYFNRKGGLWKSKLKSLLAFDFSGLKEKQKAGKNSNFDPFNTHHEIIKLLRPFAPKVFFLMKSGGFNSSNEIASTTQQSLIEKYQQAGFEVGIHPSYGCTELQEEVNLLSQWNRDICLSRHHFIKVDVRSSYRELIDAGIQHDYSMGYTNRSGFRAGVCIPHLWYDLYLDSPTELTIHPFYFMDAAFIFNLNYSPEDAIKEAFEITEQLRMYHGVNSFIFHNESLSNVGVYLGWGNLLSDVMKLVV